MLVGGSWSTGVQAKPLPRPSVLEDMIPGGRAGERAGTVRSGSQSEMRIDA